MKDTVYATLYTIVGLIILGLIFGALGLYAVEQALPQLGYK